jgi:type I restriction enzyme S subunit
MNTPSLQASRKTKKTQVGDIPVDWEVCKLGRLVSIQSGASPSLHALKSDGLYPFVKVEDLNNCLKYQAESREYSDSAAELIRIGSVIFPKRGAAISTNKVRLAARPLLMDSNMMAIFPDEGRLVSEFLYYTILFQKLYRIADTSTIPQINNKHITPYAIALPPLAEQKKIAAVLGLCDNAVEKQEHRLAWQHQFKQGLMQQLLTGQTRFKEFKGERWRAYRLGDLLEEVDRYVTFDDEHTYRLASIRRRSEGVFFREALQGKDIRTKVMKTIRTGDFMLSKMQVVHGAWGLVTPEFDGMFVSDSYIGLVPRDEKALSIEFFNYLSQTRHLRHLAYISSHGVHIEKMTFGLDDFLREKITIPLTIEEQTKIVAVLSACDRKIKLLQKQLDALEEQKRGLMQKLLTGEVRVKI